MSFPEEVITAAADLVESRDDCTPETLLAALKEELELRAQTREETWKATNNALTAHEYSEKYGLDEHQWRRARELEVLPRLEDRSPRGKVVYLDEDLDDEARSQISNSTYYSTSAAAEWLGVTTGTLARWKKAGKIQTSEPPWNKLYEGGPRRYDANFYLLSDLEKLGKKKPKKTSRAVVEAWDELNRRQRIYLEEVYRAESRREPFFTSQDSMDHPLRKGGEWRWILHTTDPLTGPTGLDETLRKKGELDPGTGSTYKALEVRGLVELKTTIPALIGMEQLWVKLTTKGRRVVKAMGR